MENYEEKYKKVLKYAKQELEDCGSQDCDVARQIFRLFPELEEIEESKIIDALKVAVLLHCSPDHNYVNTIPKSHLIYWLEKQDEKTNPYSGISFEYNGHIWGMCARDNGVDILLDKQLFKHLEKQDEQKPICKFKVGDWVVQNDVGIYKIIEVCESWYEVISYNNGIRYSIGFDKENDCHLWSIKDAKNGDVLATKKGNPFIYDKNRYNNGLAYYYAGIDANEELTLKSTYHMLSHFGELSSVFPATKEQYDLLFRKIHEAGYKWDSNKKELIRYEQ